MARYYVIVNHFNRYLKHDSRDWTNIIYSLFKKFKLPREWIKSITKYHLKNSNKHFVKLYVYSRYQAIIINHYLKKLR